MVCSRFLGYLLVFFLFRSCCALCLCRSVCDICVSVRLIGLAKFCSVFFVVVYLDCALLKRSAEFSASLVLLFVLLDSDVALLT